MKLKILLICIIAAVLLSSCVEEKKYSVSSKNSYIKCYVGNIPKSFLPSSELKEDNYNGLLNYLFDGLVFIDKGGNVVPDLSDEWSTSANGLEYSFHIRKNSKWSDGESITSNDFIRLFKSVLQSESKNRSLEYLFDIHGAKEYYYGKTAFKNVGIKADGNNILKIKLNRKCNDFVKILGSTDFLLRENSYELENLSDNFSTIKFSGAFKIQNRINEGIVLSRNMYYWNKSKIQSNTFLFVDKISCEEALARFEAGELDVLFNPPTSETERFMDDGSIIANTNDTLALTFNLKKKDALSEDTRAEIIKTLNLQSIKEKALINYKPNNYEVFKRIYSPNMQQFSYNEKYGKNIENDVKVIKLLCINDSICERIARQICAQLKEKMNLKVYLTLCSYNEVKKNMQMKDNGFQMLLCKYPGDYDRDLGIFKNLLSNNSYNFIGYKNSKLDKLINEGFYLDDANKLPIFKQCEQIVKKSKVYLPLYYTTNIVLSSDYLSGLDTGYYGYIDIGNVKQN